MAVTTLLHANHPQEFWRLDPAVPQAAWDAAMEAAGAEGDWLAIWRSSGWEGLLEHTLGEGQFGPGRYRLSAAKRLYYLLKPVLPRSLTVLARQRYRVQQEGAFPLGWPTELRYAKLLHALRDAVLARHPQSRPAALWPDDERWAFAMSHDVEAAAGRDFVRTLAAVDERYGVRAAFFFVGDRYPVDAKLLDELRERGHEVAVHGLYHDGKLFTSRRRFSRRAARINGIARKWQAVGFRSPLTHRNPEWMQELDFEYDASFFDTDPYEPMPGGTMSLWPYFLGKLVELPFTLPLDHTIMVTLRETTPRLWLEKIDAIEAHGGMAFGVTHPDYLIEPRHLAIYEEFLQEMTGRGGRWHELPREVARWWRKRAETPVPVTAGGA